MTTAKETMSTYELNELLHKHYISEKDQLDPSGAGAVYLTEVTVPNGNRRADAIHIGLWSSRGAGTIEVCELKTSRADWLRELKSPGKAEAWWPYCHIFWLVVPHAGIVLDGELPKGWGLMMPGGRGGRRFKVLTKPEEREANITPGLLVTLLKNTETTRTHALSFQRRELYKESLAREAEIRRQRGTFSSEDQERLKLLERVEEALGMKVERYPWGDRLSPEGAAGALKELARGQAAVDDAKHRAEGAVRELERAARTAEEAASKLRGTLGIKGKGRG